MEQRQADELAIYTKQLEKITGFSWKVRTPSKDSVSSFKVFCPDGPAGFESPVLFSARGLYVWGSGFASGFAGSPQK